jgi:hypothetical protein
MAKEVKTRLTRKDMENVIAGGGSVLHDGEIITKIKGLPDELDLAETPEELEEATANLDQEEKALATKKSKAASKSGNKAASKSGNK